MFKSPAKQDSGVVPQQLRTAIAAANHLLAVLQTKDGQSQE
jgi:hypothetical protein